MGCAISYLKTYTKKKYKFTRRDLHIDIPLACSGEYMTTLCRGDYDGSPSRLMYENESIKTVYPSNAIGIKKFKNELAAYKLLKKEDFIQNIYDIDLPGRQINQDLSIYIGKHNSKIQAILIPLLDFHYL